MTVNQGKLINDRKYYVKTFLNFLFSILRFLISESLCKVDKE